MKEEVGKEMGYFFILPTAYYLSEGIKGFVFHLEKYSIEIVFLLIILFFYNHFRYSNNQNKCSFPLV